MKTYRALAVGLGLVVLGGPAVASSRPPSVQARLEALERAIATQASQLATQQQTIERQADELQRLRQPVAQAIAAAVPLSKDIEAQNAEIATLQDNAEQQALRDREQPRLSYMIGRPTISSSDGRYSVALRGLVQADAAHYDQEGQRIAAQDFRRGSVGGSPNRETNAAQDLSDGAYFRRARLGVEGVFNRDFGYRFVAEFAGSGTEGPARINDAWVSYTGFAPFTVQAGAFSPPANMEDGTSPEDALFIERASASEISRSLGGADGRLGVGIRGATTRWMGALTFTGRTVNDAEVFDSQAALVGRIGHLLATSDDYNIHVGLSGTYVFRVADQGFGVNPRHAIRLRDRPEARIDSARLIDTGAIDARHASAFGLELGAQYKNLYLQAEDFTFGIDRAAANLSDPQFSGYYVQGSWILTGERRRYNMANGSFQNPRPYSPALGGGGIGAWELAARFSDMNLNDRQGAAGSANTLDGVRGGDQRIWTLGVNWYPNANMRMTLDYLDIDVRRLNPAGLGAATPFGPAPATPPAGVQIGQKAKIWAVRSQFSF